MSNVGVKKEVSTRYSLRHVHLYMSVQSISKPLSSLFLPSDRSRKRTSRSNSSPVPCSPVPLPKDRPHKDQFRELFPFAQFRVSKRSRNKIEARPPIPKTSTANYTQFSQDLKNLKYQQIQPELLGKEWGKRNGAGDSVKENVRVEGGQFFQSRKEIELEEVALHDQLVRQLSTLQEVENILEDNFKLAHMPTPLGEKQQCQAAAQPVPPFTSKVMPKSSLRRCCTCGMLTLPCIPPIESYQCGVCQVNKAHPVSPHSCIAIELLLHSEAKAAPKPPPRPQRCMSPRKERSLGADTDRAGQSSSLRRRALIPSSSSDLPISIRLCNQVITLFPNEREYLYLPFDPPCDLPSDPVLAPIIPITPSFSAHHQFQFTIEENLKDCGRRVVTEECEGVGDTSGSDFSHICTDLSLITDKTDLEISFSEPENAYIRELFDVQPSARSAAMLAKDLDTILQHQLQALPSISILALVQDYGRHIRSVIRGLVANPFSVAIEKVFKGLVLAIDGMEQEAEKWRGEVSKAVEREKGLSGKVQEIQREMTTVQQAACRTEGKLQHQIDALMRQIGKYEEQIALYRMELSNL